MGPTNAIFRTLPSLLVFTAQEYLCFSITAQTQVDLWQVYAFAGEQDCWCPLPLLACHSLCSSRYLPKHCNATASPKLLSHVCKLERVAEKLLHLL